MSRRDTIIIAVLVNAGLLMVLFTTAMKSGKEEDPFFEKTVELCGVDDRDTLVAEETLLDPYLSSLSDFEEELIFTETEEEIELIKAPAPAKEKATEQFVNVTVKKGDFLEKIANANKTTVSAILKANPQVNPNQLKVGQVLNVPIGKEEKKAHTPAQDEDYYVVKEGDNPWLIASRNHINLETLLRLNNLDEKKAKRIRPGDRLRIR